MPQLIPTGSQSVETKEKHSEPTSQQPAEAAPPEDGFYDDPLIKEAVTEFEARVLPPSPNS